MTDARGDRPVVLIVEDEIDVAESFEMWLDDEYDVRIATGGEEALELVDGVDVVLLDRMMPGMTGEEVLERISSGEADPRVAMVTAVEPGFDVVELGFDAYVTKPSSREELQETVERLLDRSALGDGLREYYSLVARREALEEQFPDDELHQREEYTDLLERIEHCRDSVDASLPDLEDDVGFVGAVREISEHSGRREDDGSESESDGAAGENDRSNGGRD